MRYDFVDQTLNKDKANIVIALMKMIIPNLHWHILKKM